MRARCLLVPAVVLLSLLPSAQALGDLGDTPPSMGPGATATGDPGARADVETPEWMAAADEDVCVDVTSVFDDPSAIIVIASHCTVMATVAVGFSDEGDLVITIAFAYAGYGVSLVLECADPRNLPRFGDSIFWGSCSPRELLQGTH